MKTRELLGRTEVRDILIGRTYDGGRIFLNIGYTDRMPVLMSGGHIPYRCRNEDNCGQMLYRINEIETPAKGWTLAELHEIRRIWDKYHMKPTNEIPADVAAKVRALVDRLQSGL